MTACSLSINLAFKACPVKWDTVGSSSSNVSVSNEGSKYVRMVLEISGIVQAEKITMLRKYGAKGRRKENSCRGTTQGKEKTACEGQHKRIQEKDTCSTFPVKAACAIQGPMKV